MSKPHDPILTDVNPDDLRWKTSSISGSNGNCVEVTMDLLPTKGHVLVRDSKHRDIAPFAFTRAEWAAFIGGARNGEFDI